MAVNVVSYPDDWPFTPIGDLITEFRGGAPLKPSDFTSTGVKVLPKGGVGRTGWLRIEDEDLQYCSIEYAEHHHRNSVDETYSIVVLRDLVPSGPSIGLIVQIREPEQYVLAQGVYGFKLKQNSDPGYLVQLSNTNWYRKLANSIMVGSTQVHITNTAFKAVQIPLPPFPEQEAIAVTLSDADALIESLERLIAKKRHIKQGTMQELVTGKKRLPGFSEEWSEQSIGELAEVGRGRVISHIEIARSTDPKYPVFSSQTSNNGVMGYLDTYDFEGNYVTWTTDGANAGTVFSRSGQFNCTNVCGTIKPSFGDHRFIAVALGRVSKSHVSRHLGNPKLMNDVMKRIKIRIPSDTSEQTAIAAILSDMNTELAELEAQLEKSRSIKQSMMQKLLTGEIRLV